MDSRLSSIVKTILKRQDAGEESPMQEESIFETPPPVPPSYYPPPPDRYMGGMSGKPFDPRRHTPVARSPSEGTPDGEKLAGDIKQQEQRELDSSLLGHLDEENGMVEPSGDVHSKNNLTLPFGYSPGFSPGSKPPAADTSPQSSLDTQPFERSKFHTSPATMEIEFVACTQSHAEIVGLFPDNASSVASAGSGGGIATTATTHEETGTTVKDGLTLAANQSESENRVRRPDPPGLLARDAAISWIRGKRYVAGELDQSSIRVSCAGAAPSADNQSVSVADDSSVTDNGSDDKENMPPSDSDKNVSTVDNHSNADDDCRAPIPLDSPLVEGNSGSMEEVERFPKVQPWINELFSPLDEGTTENKFVGKRVILSEYDNKFYFGTVVRFFRDYEVDEENSLWHVLHDDGDSEDMEEPEIEKALRIYEEGGWDKKDPSSSRYDPVFE